MAGYRCVNFYDLCRLCSSVAGEKNVQISSNETLLKKIMDCLSIQFNEKDKLPKIICSSCQEYVEVFSEFKKSCNNAQKMLESCLNSTKLRNGGQVYIKDEVPSKKVLKPIPNVNIQIASCPTTNPVKKNVITPNSPDFLSSIMQAVGIQTGEEISENTATSTQNCQQPTAIQALPQYTLTLDTLKPGQLQYKIENTKNLMNQTPLMTAKNVQNQQVILNQVDEFLKLKQKPSIILKKDVPKEDATDKKAKFNLILKTSAQKPMHTIQPSQVLSTAKGQLNQQNHKTQFLNIEKILPVVNQVSPVKPQVVVPVMIRTNNDGRIGDNTSQLLTQAITANNAAENKTSTQSQPIYMQMKLQSNADGQLTFTPATATPQQIQLALSPQQIQQLSFQTTQHQSLHPPVQNISASQDIQTQTIVQDDSTEKNDKNSEEEIFNDAFDHDFYPEDIQEDEQPQQNEEKMLTSMENTDKKGVHKKTLKPIKPVKLKTKIETAENNETLIVNPQHSEMAKKQLNLLTSYNNNINKRIENESIDKSADVNLTICDVCKKVFKRKEFLMQHLKSHIGLRPFKCEESQCNKSFSRKEHLLRHISSHTGKKEFTCNICNKLFSRKDNLNKHRRIHPDSEQTSVQQNQSLSEKKSVMKSSIKQEKKEILAKKIKLREDDVQMEAIESSTIQNQIPQPPKILQVQQIEMKNENSQQIILSVSQAQAMLSQSKAVYSLTPNFIFNQHASFITPNQDVVGSLKCDTQ